MKAYTPTNWVRRKTWIGIVLIAIGVLGWWVGEMKKTYAEAKAKAMQANTTPRVLTTPAREQRFNERTISVYSPTNSWSEPVNVGLREFKLHLGAPSFIKRNGVPILDKTNNLVIFLPQGKERLGDGIKTLEFKSLGTNATHEIAVKSW